jgi:hypothetical protein
MTGLVFLVEQVALGLYILIAVGVLLTFFSWRRSRRAVRSTNYELEKALARETSGNKLANLVMLLELAAFIAGIQFVVAPQIRASAGVTDVAALLQPQDGEFVPPTQGPVGADPIDASNVQIGEDPLELRVLATPVPTPTPVGTLVDNPPDVIGCDTPNAQLQVPANGMIVFEPTTLRGTAFVDNFSSYKIEINGPDTFGSFAPIDQKTAPVTELGELGQFTPAFYTPGEYRFRLSVFDITNTLRASCDVLIIVSLPIPTATPIGGTTP